MTAHPGSTLLGMPGFPATARAEKHDTLMDIPLFVTPATVTAITKAKSHGALPKVVIDELAVSPAIAHAPLPRREPQPATVPVQRPDIGPAEPDSGPATRGHRWETFEDLGLAPRPLTKKAQKLVVSLYRLLGFGILSLIVFVLLGYIATTAFYFLNKTWVTPVAISSNDEKVVALQAQLATQLNEREKLVYELDQSERLIAAEQEFQMQFARAIKRDLQGRRLALGRVKQLALTAAATRQEIRTTNGDFSASAAAKMNDEYDAGMIDRDAMLAGKFQLAQISSANLSLAERQAEFDQRAAELASQTQSLDALLSDKGASAALSYDVLKIARDYETSKLALARELGNRERLQASIARHDQIIDGIQQSSYLRVLDDHAAVALVPYDNLGNVAPGTTLYGCKLNMVMCKEVGTVREILPGEVQLRHPKRDTLVRGRMIAMETTSPDAATAEVLFAGGKPLGF